MDNQSLPEIPAESLRITEAKPPISSETTTESVQFSCQTEKGNITFFVDIHENHADGVVGSRAFFGKFTVASLKYQASDRYFIYFEATGTGAIYEKAYVPRKSREEVFR
ncbi:MAG: hypothetical protein KA052_03555 [Candidatus Pacebacteria bacterium]|nr:hypothetical protein [Candidatus Paceibacterota bacterium]